MKNLNNICMKWKHYHCWSKVVTSVVPAAANGWRCGRRAGRVALCCMWGTMRRAARGWEKGCQRQMRRATRDRWEGLAESICATARPLKAKIWIFQKNNYSGIIWTYFCIFQDTLVSFPNPTFKINFTNSLDRPLNRKELVLQRKEAREKKVKKQEK